MSSTPKTRDFEYFKLLLKYEQQNYYELHEDCLREKILFEDDLFPIDPSSYYLHNARPQAKREKIEWLRPSQIVSNEGSVDFIHTSNSFSVRKKPKNRSKNNISSVDFQSQFNFMRGRYGCSNFISALSILYCNDDNFGRVVPEDQSFDSINYAGVFHFRIWQYGKWYDIVVDDRLPTMNGKPIQVHSYNYIEFWPALLEKAFAKLNGCYQSLHGCALEEFLEDMTGGMCENISADMPVPLNEGLCQILHNSVKIKSHVIVRISEDKSSKEKSWHSCAKRPLTNGLIKNQSYMVLQAKLFDHLGPDKTFHLIKLCNPWKRLNQMLFGKCKDETSGTKENERGWNDGKWNGSWSEHSPEWINLSDEVKAQCGLLLDNDCYFWMPIETFVDTFTDVTICHTTSTQISKSSPVWHSALFHGYWISGLSAGGCYNEKTFHQNPMYLLPIQGNKIASSPASDTSKASESKETSNQIAQYTVLVSLMQKYRNSKRITGIPDLKIGFHLFKLEPDDLKYIQEVIYEDHFESSMQSKANYEKAKVCLKMKSEFFHVKKGEQALKFFTNVREVSARYKLAEGNYLVIPSTYGPNCDGNFLLRLYCEVPFKFANKDVLTLVKAEKDPQVRITKAYFSDRMFSRPFEKIATVEEFVDVEHLEILLKSVTTSNRNYFNLDQCQTLLALYDLDCKGTLSYVQLQQLCIDIDECYQLFLRHDKTVSRSVSFVELRTALAEIGINVNARVIEILLNRYGSKMKIVVKGVPVRELKFSNFTICVLKLRKTLIYWDIKFRSSPLVSGIEQKTDSSPTNKISQHESNSCNFTLVEFVKQIIYS